MTASTSDKPKLKKQRRDGQAEEERKSQVQHSPFAPTGKFKTNETLDCHYTVEPRKRWADMTRYNSFVCGWSTGTILRDVTRITKAKPQ